MNQGNDPRNGKSLNSLERQMKKLRAELDRLAKENIELARKVDALEVKQAEVEHRQGTGKEPRSGR